MRGPGTLGMAGERKESQDPGSHVFLRTGQKAEEPSPVTGVCKQWPGHGLPQGHAGAGWASPPLPAFVPRSSPPPQEKNHRGQGTERSLHGQQWSGSMNILHKAGKRALKHWLSLGQLFPVSASVSLPCEKGAS